MESPKQFKARQSGRVSRLLNARHRETLMTVNLSGHLNLVLKWQRRGRPAFCMLYHEAFGILVMEALNFFPYNTLEAELDLL